MAKGLDTHVFVKPCQLRIPGHSRIVTRLSGSSNHIQSLTQCRTPVRDSSASGSGERPGKRTIDYVYERYSEVLEKRLAKLNEEF